METPVHRMVSEGDNGDEVLYLCPEVGCGRRVVLSRAGRMVVLDQGDFGVSHTGGNIDVTSFALSQ